MRHRDMSFRSKLCCISKNHMLSRRQFLPAYAIHLHSLMSRNTECTMALQSKITYNEVYRGECCNCPIPPPVCISQDCSNKGSQIASSLPCSHIASSRGISIMQLFCQVSNKVCRDAIIGQPLTAFSTQVNHNS